jgi:hypothetical protein
MLRWYYKDFLEFSGGEVDAESSPPSSVSPGTSSRVTFNALLLNTLLLRGGSLDLPSSRGDDDDGIL